MKDNNKITFLDLVIPLVCIYTSGLVFHSYFYSDGLKDNPIVDVVVIFFTSTFFCYGLFAFSRDVYHMGLKGVLKNLKFKKKEQ